MKILLTGAKGMLGTDVAKRLKNLDIEYIGIDREEVDITDKSAVYDFISEFKPNAIIHCAAYAAVDKAETERDAALNINAVGTDNLVKATASVNAKFLYISTDYVFDGQAAAPYETDAKCSPVNWYGQTKLKGEEFIQERLSKYFIIRTSWMFGRHGNNFVKTMLRLSEVKSEINVVNDQIGSPTFTEDLAVLLCEMIHTEKYGMYHATNEGFCSWYEFAKIIFEYSGKPIKVNAVTTEEYKTAAKRPKNSRLSKASLDRADFLRLPDWEDALKRYMLDKRKGDQ